MIKKQNLHVSLKSKYPMVLKQCLIFTLLIFITAFYFNQKVSLQITDLPLVFSKPADIIPAVLTDFEIEKIKAPATPLIPIEAEGDEGLTDLGNYVLPGDYNNIFDPVAVPDFSENGEPAIDIPFQIYDQEPVPVGGFSAIQRNVIYPEIAMEAGMQGAVLIRAFIDKKGNVGECMVIKGIENSGLNEAAIAAIKKTKFQPAMQRDKKVGVWISIPVIFKLR